MSDEAAATTTATNRVRPIIWWLGLAGCVLCAVCGTLFAYQDGLPPIFGEIEFLDKVCHFSVFGAIAFFLDGVLKRRSIIGGRVPLAAVLILVPAGIEEFLQRYSPNRSSSFADYAADVAGVAIAIALSRRVR